MNRYKKIFTAVLIIIVLFTIIIQSQTKTVDVNTGENLEIHFIDVGQGDATLIKNGDEYMLIDAGTSEKSIVNYLKDQNINKLKYVIGTHPHEDHIGGLDKVIDNFNVEKVIMPNAVATTKTFEDVLDSISNKGLKITRAKSGDKYDFNGSEFTIMAPNSEEYSNLNNYSVVIKLIHGSNSFLFTGDAERLSETEMLDKYAFMLKSDLLHLGHHGSDTSTTQDFLDAVNPQIGVISLGKDNKYRHPDKIVLDRLMDKNINLYRTDEDGTMIALSDGNTISIGDQEVSSRDGIVELLMDILNRIMDLIKE